MLASDGFVMTPTGEKIVVRGSLHTRSWKDAETILAAKIAPYLRGESVESDKTIHEAIKIFLKAKRLALPARKDFGGVSDSVVAFRERSGSEADDEQEQVRKYGDVLTPFAKFCTDRGLILLKQITVDHLDNFESTWVGRPIWKDGEIVGHQPKTQGGKERYRQNLSIFFNFCVDRDYMTKNPAKKLLKIVKEEHEIVPFTDQEWHDIFSMIEPTFPRIHKMVKAYVLVLKESALRMGDVVKLRPQDINESGEVEIGKMEKTSHSVYVTLPPEVLDALKAFEHRSKNYFFWSGNGQLETAKKDWSEYMLRLFTAAKIEGGMERRSHNFRKTLLSKVANEAGLDAAMTVGAHKNIKTTQKHYYRFTNEGKDKVRNALDAVRAKEKRNKLDSSGSASRS